MKTRISAKEYASEIGKSESTARRLLEQMVISGHAQRITTFSEYSYKDLNGHTRFGSVRAIAYEVTHSKLERKSVDAIAQQMFDQS